MMCGIIMPQTHPAAVAFVTHLQRHGQFVASLA